ncbi:MAG TPA: hypothetical protein DCP11_14885 [Microbacteriaceae bacterium]|nr:hypothetical protein [Microbacteriaceae bacterium]
MKVQPTSAQMRPRARPKSSRKVCFSPRDAREISSTMIPCTSAATTTESSTGTRLTRPMVANEPATIVGLSALVLESMRESEKSATSPTTR